MNGSPAHDENHDLTIDEVDAELLRIVTQRNHLDDPSYETERTLAAAQVGINDTMTRLKAYPDELRRTILQHSREHGQDINRISVLVWVNQGWSVSKLNEYFAFNQALETSTPSSLLDGLRYYPQLPQSEDYTTADQQTQQQVHALLIVAQKLGAEKYERASAYPRHPHLDDIPLEYIGPDYSYKIEGDDLINLILEHPQHADWIADIILERNTSDAHFIRSIIASSTPSISNGIL